MLRDAMIDERQNVRCDRDHLHLQSSALASPFTGRLGSDGDSPQLPMELIVVDNASTDETPQVIEAFSKRLPVRRLAEPRAGNRMRRIRLSPPVLEVSCYGSTTMLLCNRPG